MPNPIDKYRHNAILEGGSSGSGSGSGGGGKAFRMVEEYGGPAMLVGAGAAGYADYKDTKARYQQKEDEAAAEIKRESRGVEKTSTDRARDDAREMKMQQQNEKASKEASRDMGFSKGGSASARADGIAQRGKTKGTIVMCGGGMYK